MDDLTGDMWFRFSCTCFSHSVVAEEDLQSGDTMRRMFDLLLMHIMYGHV